MKDAVLLLLTTITSTSLYPNYNFLFSSLYPPPDLLWPISFYFYHLSPFFFLQSQSYIYSRSTCFFPFLLFLLFFQSNSIHILCLLSLCVSLSLSAYYNLSFPLCSLSFSGGWRVSEDRWAPVERPGRVCVCGCMSLCAPHHCSSLAASLAVPRATSYRINTL